MKNETRFSSTFKRFPAPNGTKTRPETNPKTTPKTHQKYEGRGKPIPAKEREARYLSLQSSQNFNRGCRNPSLDAQILARMPESSPGCSNPSQDTKILARMPKSDPRCPNPSWDAQILARMRES